MRDARGVHADAVHRISLVHRRPVMRDDDELYPSRKLRQEIREPLHIGLVENGVGLIFSSPNSSETTVNARSPPLSDSSPWSFLPGGLATMSIPVRSKSL